MTLPADDSLLDLLGRVQQSAIQLHGGVRDAINQLTGQRSDHPLELTLSQAIRYLEARVGNLPAGDQRTELLAWIHEQGMPAADRRTRVTSARTFIAHDGKQSLRDATTGDQFDADDLFDVAYQLAQAARTLPTGPYAQ